MSNFTQLNLPQLELWSEYKRLLSAGVITETVNVNGVCITTTSDHPDDINYGSGSLVYDWDKSYYDDSQLIVPKRDTILNESDFGNLATRFKGTLFEEVYNVLSTRYVVGRIRIMRSEPKTCLSWHKDNTRRIHYVMKTQPGCLMVIDDEAKHLPQDTWWATNTLLEHTALNGSKENRYHLVVCVLSDK